MKLALMPFLVLLVAGAGVARADTIDQFTIYEDYSGGSLQETFSFTLPAVNTVNLPAVDSGLEGMAVLGVFESVPVTLTGFQFGTPGTYLSSVVSSPNGLGILIEQFGGSVIFTYNPADTIWTSSGPEELTFIPGTESTPSPEYIPPGDQAILTITPIATAEPGTLAMLAVGVGPLIGFSLKRKRTPIKTVA